jgi:hypothetical protein
MPELDFGDIYKKIKSGSTSKYKGKASCVMLLKSICKHGSIPKFCAEAMIGITTFYRWKRAHVEFNACYETAKMIAYNRWIDEGEFNKDNEEFNSKHWESVGRMHYEYGKQAKIRLNVNPESDPYTQCQEILTQANNGEFNSSELKQVMESINVGIRAHEAFKMQAELDQIKADMQQIRDAAHG